MTKKFTNMQTHSTNVRLYRVRQRIKRIALYFFWNYTPTISKIITKRAFFTPAKYRINSAERSYLEHATAFEISVHDKTIQCWKWGRGPGILLVHGWSGRGIQLHGFIEPLIRAGYAVFTFDGPGHGESQGKTSSYFELTDAVRAFISSSNGNNIKGVIAYSLGGSAVINGLAKENHSLEAVLIAPALKLKDVLHNTFTHHGVPQPIYQNLISKLEHKFGYNMHRDDPHKLVKEITPKILIVHDRNDLVIPYIDSKEVAEQIENVVLHTTRGLGHKRILNDSSVIDLTVKHFEGNGG